MMLGKPCAGPDCSYSKYQLRFTSGSTAENFFKVQAEDGAWYYITVYPHNNPVRGSGTPGDLFDKMGRYRVLWLTKCCISGYVQYWGNPQLFPALNLPDPPF